MHLVDSCRARRGKHHSESKWPGPPLFKMGGQSRHCLATAPAGLYRPGCRVVWAACCKAKRGTKQGRLYGDLDGAAPAHDKESAARG